MTDGGTEGDTSGIMLTDTSPPASDTEYATDANPESFTSGCSEVDVNIDQKTPTLVLLVDQSSSMTSDFQGVERWTAIYDTLMDPGSGVVQGLEDQIRFGLTLYSSENGFENGNECPMLTTVDPALNNYGAMDNVFSGADVIEDTPTGESLEATAIALAGLDVDGPKGIVLATDGEPDTCDEPDPQNGQDVAIAAGQTAWNMGIKTFVISVGDEVGADHLQEMANVGVGKAPDADNPAPYYQALNPQELVAAFDEIVGGFISCTFTIDGEVDLNKKCEGTVVLDGMVLECGTDWDVPQPTTLELMGEACEILKDGEPHAVDANWPCGVVTPVG
jgi:hypothetical protein